MNRRGLSPISLACTLLAATACGTEEFRGHVLIASDQPAPDKGGVLLEIAPAEYSDEHAEGEIRNLGRTPYYLLADGDVVCAPDGTAIWALVGGAPTWTYYLPAGPHHFTIGEVGQPPIFEGDGQIPSGGTANLFLYGPVEQAKGVFAPTPMIPSAGNEHITVANLLRSGQTLEVVTCSDATTCTPISPALALGDVFDAEVPAVFDDCDRSSFSNVGSWSTGGCFTSRTTRGAGIGYRLVPTASFRNPPVNALTWGMTDLIGDSSSPRAPIFVAAPAFMTEQGQSKFVLF
jgi:hypothetical protein